MWCFFALRFPNNPLFLPLSVLPFEGGSTSIVGMVSVAAVIGATATVAVMPPSVNTSRLRFDKSVSERAEGLPDDDEADVLMAEVDLDLLRSVSIDRRFLLVLSILEPCTTGASSAEMDLKLSPECALPKEPLCLSFDLTIASKISSTEFL